MVKFVNILLLASAVTAFSLEKSSSRISSQNKIRSSLQGSSLPRQDIHSVPTFLKAASDASIPEIVAAATPAEPAKKSSFIDAIW